MQISFYLRDEEVPGLPDKVKIARSQYVEFRLDPTRKVQAPSAEADAPPRAPAAPPPPSRRRR